MIQLPKFRLPHSVRFKRTSPLTIPPTYRRIMYLVLVVIFMLLTTASQPADGPVPKTQTSASQSQFAIVTEVVDGDTIKIETGETVRYIGIDTPETKHPQKAVECFGREASAANADLVLGMRVRLDSDVSNTDRYGRLLRYVYLDDTFVNEYLVRHGYAHATAYPPDVKYQESLEAAEEAARSEGLGFWDEGGCVD